MTSVLGRLRRARFVAAQVTDGGVVLVLCAIVIVVAGSEFVEGRLDLFPASADLTFVAAALGIAAALTALVAARLLGDHRPSWIGAAMLLYGLVVLPNAALLTGEPRTSTNRLASLLLLTVALVIMLVGLRPPARLGGWGGWALLVVGLGLGALLNSAEPTGFTDGLSMTPFSSVVTLVGWTVVAVVFLLDGYRRQSRLRSRLGLGLSVIAVSQLHRQVVPGLPMTNLIYPSLRALGMAIVLLALVQMVLRQVNELQSEYSVQEEELGRATLHLERATLLAAERDHELRNGLAGLAGAAHLLSSRGGGDDAERLRLALLSELGRLRLMLESPLAVQMAATDAEMDATHGEPAEHLLRPLLESLVELQVELPIELEAEADLCAATAPSVTSHIVTNLLANCARHAPGSPVTVRGRPGDGDTVVIEVRDAGPGLPAGAEDRVFERGVHDESAGGSGLGLHISRRMAEQNGGSLQLRTVQDPVGCLAVLTLPSARSRHF
ncbi:HAMP domain-containing sensor histidine kinase [Pseudonocardia sp. KRD291]|uniref:sensor histidine kinase n=1 Tax=Pseudonocardia sp. KRD291 TaxID=2792007 RepID=UPI001C4A3CA0|nr:HAMP domain-containing sensor histidine kinase [Pseudonocardia sp. KRD291]MBW0106691.1 HAMP domain-containing histidine kinase [Pseudonocardia sp. KRD291]